MSDSRQWYHVTITTYGNWLYGDSRGFRTRHHREHVEGDYRNPPPAGRYTELEQRSRESLKQVPVFLSLEQRRIVGEALRDRLIELGAEVACLAVAGRHIHLLARIPFDRRRDWIGAAKRHVWFVLREHGKFGKLWAKRSREQPVSDPSHRDNIVRYILRHESDGAWVWSAPPVPNTPAAPP